MQWTLLYNGHYFEVSMVSRWCPRWFHCRSSHQKVSSRNRCSLKSTSALWLFFTCDQNPWKIFLKYFTKNEPRICFSMKLTIGTKHVFLKNSSRWLLPNIIEAEMLWRLSWNYDAIMSCNRLCLIGNRLSIQCRWFIWSIMIFSKSAIRLLIFD